MLVHIHSISLHFEERIKFHLIYLCPYFSTSFHNVTASDQRKKSLLTLCKLYQRKLLELVRVKYMMIIVKEHFYTTGSFQVEGMRRCLGLKSQNLVDLLLQIKIVKNC